MPRHGSGPARLRGGAPRRGAHGGGDERGTLIECCVCGGGGGCAQDAHPPQLPLWEPRGHQARPPLVPGAGMEQISTCSKARLASLDQDSRQTFPPRTNGQRRGRRNLPGSRVAHPLSVLRVGRSAAFCHGLLMAALLLPAAVPAAAAAAAAAGPVQQTTAACSEARAAPGRRRRL